MAFSSIEGRERWAWYAGGLVALAVASAVAFAGVWLRAFIVGAVALVGIALWRLTRKRSWGRLALACITAVAFAIAFAVAFNSLGAGIVAFAAAVGFAVAGGGRVAGAVIVGVAVAVGFAFALAGTDAGAFVTFLSIVGIVVAMILLVCSVAIRHRRQGVFLALFLPASLATCLCTAPMPARLPTWQHTGPLLLFLALLTLVDAPFNWASLGLTRALLRRGLELEGWWPCLLGLVDAALAGLIVSLLALSVVVAAQAVLAWGLVFHLMPRLGLNLLDMARAVETFELPARIGRLFTGT